jgi:hypothetical protein
LIVVATNEEYKIAKKRWKHRIIIKTGVGGANVIKKLRRLPKWIPIINFGYAGSMTIPVGTEVKVGQCVRYHPHTQFDEPIWNLNGEVRCYTQDDYIKPKKTLKNEIYDMELAYICALDFKNVKSIKIISDNCNQEEYNEFIKGEK